MIDVCLCITESRIQDIVQKPDLNFSVWGLRIFGGSCRKDVFRRLPWMAAGGLRLCHVTGSCDWRLRGSLTRQAPKSHDRHLHHQPSSSLPDLPTVTATNNRLLDDQGILLGSCSSRCLSWVSGAFEGWLLSADGSGGLGRRPFGHGCRGMPSAMSHQCRSASPARQEHMTPHNVCV